MTTTKQKQQSLSPNDALALLVDGNKRFVENQKQQIDYSQQVKDTGSGQFPFAAILGCIDSRVPAEIVFDQGIGDIFNARVAGNVVNEDVLGSLEYACKVAGSKVILVLGHTKCGAVTSACQNVELGNITALLSKIKPAIELLESGNAVDEVEKVAIHNVNVSISQIRKESSILKEMEDNGEIMIVGASYDVETGKVNFL
jgi:carbonic anhydrase